MSNNSTDNLDALLYSASRYAGQHELNLYEHADETFKPSNKFIHKMKKFLRQSKRVPELKEERPFMLWAKRATATVLVIISLGFALIMSISAVRDTLWQAIIHWYKESISVIFKNSEDVQTLTEILAFKEPSGLTEEYERYEIIKNEQLYIVEYESNDNLITYQQRISDDSALNLSNNETIMSKIKIAGYDGFYTKFITNGVEQITILWSDGSYVYSLEGNVTLDQLLEIASNIK